MYCTLTGVCGKTPACQTFCHPINLSSNGQVSRAEWFRQKGLPPNLSVLPVNVFTKAKRSLKVNTRNQ